MMVHEHDHSKVLGLILDLDVDRIYIVEQSEYGPTVYWRVNEEHLPPLSILTADVNDMRTMRTDDDKEIAIIEIARFDENNIEDSR